MIRHGCKDAMHPRNRFRTGYDFEQLVASNPTLAPFVAPNPYGDLSIDYANQSGVKALNRALLAHAYGVRHWDVPRLRVRLSLGALTICTTWRICSQRGVVRRIRLSPIWSSVECSRRRAGTSTA
jgi:hypothetical protein